MTTPMSMPATPSRTVLVLGGGITGLVAAYRLSAAPGTRVVLVEAGSRLGGKLLTHRRDGFVVDTGPESLAPGKPHAARLAAELGVDLAPAADGAPGAVLVNGRLRTMPAGIGGFIPRQIAPLALTRLFTPLGKLRMALEALVPARAEETDESLEAFASRRLGRQAYRRLIEPVASGIFCADPSRLSLLATMPHLRAAERTHGGLLQAVLAERKAAARKPSGPRPGLTTPSTGMGRLVEALVERLEAADDVELRVSTRLAGLRRTAEGYEATLDEAALDAGGQETLAVDAVVLAVPSHAAAHVLDGLGAAQPAATLRAMPYDSVATVSLGYRAGDLPALDRALPAHGYLLAEPGRGSVRAVTRSSAKYAGRAPRGHELFRVTVRPGADDTDADLVALATAELHRTLAVQAVPVLEHVHRWAGVMPQYQVGHLDLVTRVEEQLGAFPGVVLAGSGVHGLGIPDCVASAESAAARLTA